MTGRLLAQLACVALVDADNVAGAPYAWPPPPPPTDAQLREMERLRVLGWQLAYAARRAGHADIGGDATWGQP